MYGGFLGCCGRYIYSSRILTWLANWSVTMYTAKDCMLFVWYNDHGLMHSLNISLLPWTLVPINLDQGSVLVLLSIQSVPWIADQERDLWNKYTCMSNDVSEVNTVLLPPLTQNIFSSTMAATGMQLKQSVKAFHICTS